MEAVKLGRRRISNLDSNGYRQMKRRMVNGVCHLEGGGGSWHITNILPEKASPITGAAAAGYLTSDTKQQSPTKQQHLDFSHQNQQHHPALNGGEALNPHVPTPHSHIQHHPTGNHSGPPPPLLEPSQQTSTIAQPVLPPSLQESERLQSVERWINSIPLDAPVFVQTALTQIVPISDPKSFPDELAAVDPASTTAATTTGRKNDSSDTSLGGVNYDVYSRQSQQPAGGYGNGSPGVRSRGNTTTASSGKPHVTGLPHLPPSPPTLAPPGDGDSANGNGNYPPHARYHGGAPNFASPQPNPHNQRISDRSLLHSPPTRFFDDYETQFIVKLFSDFFTSGACPSLSEVRRRTAHSQLQARRNINSIRAKIKRLQVSGRWTDYAIL